VVDPLTTVKEFMFVLCISNQWEMGIKDKEGILKNNFVSVKSRINHKKTANCY